MGKILTLGIETSCDETSVSIVEDGRNVLCNVISSQIETHRKFGGVVPEVASRMHLESINNIIKEAFDQAKLNFSDIDTVGVTKGPGLIGALLVGISAGKAISTALNIPLIGVNHMRGHICAAYITHTELEPPFIALVVSGGHTYIVNVMGYCDFKVMGRTRDDAVGESFDKVARSLNLSYPGGPEIDRLAKLGDPTSIDFPRIFLENNSYDFSLSGLKTSVLNYLNQQAQKKQEIVKENVCASFQAAVMDVLEEKTKRALKETGLKKLVISGGVASNSELRKRFQDISEKMNIKTYFPDRILCTDNGAMIASSAYYEYLNNNISDLYLRVYPNLEIDDL